MKVYLENPPGYGRESYCTSIKIYQDGVPQTTTILERVKPRARIEGRLALPIISMQHYNDLIKVHAKHVEKEMYEQSDRQ